MVGTLKQSARYRVMVMAKDWQGRTGTQVSTLTIKLIGTAQVTIIHRISYNDMLNTLPEASSSP